MLFRSINQKIKTGEKYVIRQKIDTVGTTVFTDLVRGKIEIENSTLDDSVLIKSDGWPTYNFANVIDDHLMKITHIIRGEEYITSTPKYIQLYQVFGWDIPKHIHLSLILNKDKSKLSKRDGDVSVEDYIKKGYLPETIINFVALLGWNPGDDRELFSLEELVKEFDLKKLNKSGAVFDHEKLDWMNGHYIRFKIPEEITELCWPYLKKYLEKNYQIKLSNFTDGFIESVVVLEQERIKRLGEVGEKTHYFFHQPEYDSQMLIWRKSDAVTTKSRLEFLIKYLSEVPKENWTRNTLEESLLTEIEKNDFDNGTTLWPMRVALSGEQKSPSPFELAEVLGKKETLKRIYNESEVT